MTASDEAKKALEGVTPGPWFCMDYTTEEPIMAGWYIVPHDAVGTIAKVNPHFDQDASFIAWAREGVPALLAEIAALRAKLVAAVSIADSALNAVAEVQNYKQPDDPWTENALTMQELDIFDFDVSTARAALASMKGGA